MIFRSHHSERSEESPHFVHGRTGSNLVRMLQFLPTGAPSPASGRRVPKAEDHQEPKTLSEPHVIPLGRSNNKIPPVHQGSNAAVLVHPPVTRNVEGDLIPEKPAFSKALIGPGISRINQLRDPRPFRTYKTGPEKHNRLWAMHSLLGTPRLQPWASHPGATRGALAPGACPPFHTDLLFLNAQSNLQSTTAPLTPTIELTQALTVRRKPDCTI
jgi:hypothetical protein